MVRMSKLQKEFWERQKDKKVGARVLLSNGRLGFVTEWNMQVPSGLDFEVGTCTVTLDSGENFGFNQTQVRDHFDFMYGSPHLDRLNLSESDLQRSYERYQELFR